MTREREKRKKAENDLRDKELEKERHAKHQADERRKREEQKAPISDSHTVWLMEIFFG